MRLTFGLVLCSIITSLAGNTYSQTARISLNVSNATIVDIFREIERNSEFGFFFKSEELNLDSRKTVNLKDATIDEVLRKVLDENCSYKIVDKNIVITREKDIPVVTEAQQGRRVTGTVKDNSGGSLPGVSIVVKGTHLGLLTDPSGNYTVTNVPENAILVFSFVGMKSQEVVVANRSVINVVLEEEAVGIDEVVIVGYGTQKKSNVTNSVSIMKNSNLEERAIARVDQALVGQMAGINVKQTTGVPGKAFSIQVRGTGSISAGNEPLYVIDGFPLATATTNGAGNFATGNPLDNINPNDIESIQVLKDASAAAIYGSRASNGVILITTKRGQAGKPKITYNTYFGINQASRKVDMLDGQGWIDRATEIINGQYVAAYGAKGAKPTDDTATRTSIVGAFNANYFLDPRWAQAGHPGLVFINWQDEIFRTGMMQNHEVSASGGNDIVKYFVSGNFVNQDGFVKHTGIKSYSARANVEVRANDHLKVGINIAPTYSVIEDPGIEGKDNIYHQSLSMSPVQEETSGHYANSFNNGQYSWSNTTNSVLAKVENIVGETKRFRTLTSLYAEYDIIKGLSFRTSLNLDNTDNTSRSYVPYTVASTLLSRTFDPAAKALTSNTSGSYNTFKRQTFVNENTLTYNAVIGRNHNINLLLGQSYNFDRTDNSSMSSSGGYTSSVIQTLNAASAVTGSSSATQNVLLSYFSRVQYSFRDKYLFSASIREDGSSRFGKNAQYGIFPSASIGWSMVKEEFMKKLDVISDLKLRASYGANGTNNLGSDYASIPTLVSSGYALGSTVAAVIGQSPSKIANPDLQWERSVTYDVGFDFGLFNNRLTGSFDYYNKLNTKLLLNVQVPEVTGFSTYLSNTGSVRNIGQELELTSHNLTGKFQWNTTLTISHNTNKVVALGPGQSQILIPSSFDISNFILKVGQPMNSIYVVKMLGCLTSADIANKVALYGTETVGDPKYEDFSGPKGVPDGVIDAYDRQIVGHPNPDYTWGFTNSFKYKGFDLSVLIQGQNGGSIYSLLGRAITRTGQGFNDNAPSFYQDRWKSESDPGAGRVSKVYSTFGRIVNTDWLYSSDYIRVRNITLGYNLGQVIPKGILQGARIYVTAENFFGKDKYYGGANPDATNTDLSGNASYLAPGDYGGLPLAKSLIFGLNVTF
ncbi:MAG: TonB-dependent receptor [Marinilabiliales bacterium]|nr:TonB-dependent receptor [Marinilabiliales bacterium]